MTAASPAEPADALDHRLQAAVLAALDTLVALAQNRDDPKQARLAAAEILRFSSRRKAETPQPRREHAGGPGAITRGLGAMLDLLIPAASAAESPHPDAREPLDQGAARAAAPVEPDPSVKLPAEPPADADSPGIPPSAPPANRFMSARKRKRERQRAAKAQGASSPPVVAA